MGGNSQLTDFQNYKNMKMLVGVIINTLKDAVTNIFKEKKVHNILKGRPREKKLVANIYLFKLPDWPF